MTRSDEPLFDPRLADWLEDDPHTAPDRTLEVVLAAFPSIKQRRASRVPWRIPAMSAPLRLGLAAAAVVIAAVGGVYLLQSGSGPGVGGPSPSSQPASVGPSPSAAASTAAPATPQISTFTSPLYGYTVDHPAAYRPTAATEAWPAGGVIGPDQAWVDRFLAQPTGATVFVGIASQEVPAGQTADQWLAAYAASVATRECAVPLDAWTDTTVAAAAGRRAEFVCDGHDGAEVAWVVDGRGWVATGQPAVVDLMLASIRYP